MTKGFFLEVIKYQGGQISGQGGKNGAYRDQTARTHAGQQGISRSRFAGEEVYPLEVYLVVGQIEQLPVGIYKYRIQGHELVQKSDEEKRQALAAASYGQRCIERGAINIVIAAVYERTARKYGERAERYVHMEVGHAAQNIYLQAVALELGTVVVGAFDDSRVKKTLLMDEYPLCIMPVGRAGY